MAKSNSDKISTGNCGQYFVAAELERRGFTAALTLVNTKDFDILAINRQNGKQFAIQVKTTSHDEKRWVLSKKVLTLQGKNIFYIFVVLHGKYGAPEYHIAPSTQISKVMRLGRERWLKTPGKKGQKHNDNNVHPFRDDKNKYLNRWEYLK